MTIAAVFVVPLILSPIASLDPGPLPPDRIPTFYGQSAALVSILAEAGKSSDLISFLRLAETSGYDRALRDVYGIAGAGELEQMCQSGGTLRRAGAIRVATHEVE